MNIETAPPHVPVHAEVDYTFSVRIQFNITPFVARQKVNSYLLMNVGNMVTAGEPTLLLNGEAFWKVPVFCAYPEFKWRKHLGDLAMNAESGEIDFARSSFASAHEIEARANAIGDAVRAPRLSTNVNRINE